MNKTQWTVSNIEGGKYLGPVEFQDINEEWHIFEIMETKEKLVFGGACNVGFLESGYMLKDQDFSLDENLSILMDDLEAYYNHGKETTNKIIFNERM